MNTEHKLLGSIVTTVLIVIVGSVLWITLWPAWQDAIIRSMVAQARSDLHAMNRAMAAYNLDHPVGFGVQHVRIDDNDWMPTTLQACLDPPWGSVQWTEPSFLPHRMRWCMPEIDPEAFAAYLTTNPYPRFPVDWGGRLFDLNQPRTWGYRSMRAPPTGVLTVAWNGNVVDYTHYFTYSYTYRYLAVSMGPVHGEMSGYVKRVDWQDRYHVEYDPTNGVLSHGFIRVGERIHSATEAS